MKRLILPLLALSAVGCSSGHQYDRGAYTTSVRAPAFDPMTDAPHTTGQPGYVNGQKVERSTNKRYAEPSREPRMMAADGDSKRAVELMFSETVPKETPPGIQRDEYEKCWKDFIKAMKNERDAVLALSAEEARCLRNRVLAHCGGRLVYKRLGPNGGHEYENFMADEENIKMCGKKHQWWTKRVSTYMLRFEDFGDDVLGWK